MSCFEDCMASQVVDVSSWSDTDTANLRSKCIGQVVTVQVQCCDNVKVSRTSQILVASAMSAIASFTMILPAASASF